MNTTKTTTKTTDEQLRETSLAKARAVYDIRHHQVIPLSQEIFAFLKNQGDAGAAALETAMSLSQVLPANQLIPTARSILDFQNGVEVEKPDRAWAFDRAEMFTAGHRDALEVTIKCAGVILAYLDDNPESQKIKQWAFEKTQEYLGADPQDVAVAVNLAETILGYLKGDTKTPLREVA